MPAGQSGSEHLQGIDPAHAVADVSTQHLTGLNTAGTGKRLQDPDREIELDAIIGRIRSRPATARATGPKLRDQLRQVKAQVTHKPRQLGEAVVDLPVPPRVAAGALVDQPRAPGLVPH